MAEKAVFEWTNWSGMGDPAPQLGIALGMKVIRDAIKAAGNDYEVLWTDKGKMFIIVKDVGTATAVSYSDFELMQSPSPEALAESFETRVQNAIMTLQQSAFIKRVRNSAEG